MASKLEELILKYPKIFEQYEGNPSMVNWLDLPEGWISVVDKLCEAIQSYIDNVTRYTEGKTYKTPQVTCTQMKEKFGGLRFYVNGGDNHTDGMIYMAEHLCSLTCQKCGSEKNIGQTKGWIATLCEECGKEQSTWKMNNE